MVTQRHGNHVVDNFEDIAGSSVLEVFVLEVGNKIAWQIVRWEFQWCEFTGGVLLEPGTLLPFGGIPKLDRGAKRRWGTVQFGFANRYGAITANGQGETVLGQIMMLKDANSKNVIQEVKKRVAEIQENLPE